MIVSIDSMDEVKRIVELVETNLFELKNFMKNVNGTVTTQNTDEKHLTTIVKDISESISAIVIGSAHSKIYSITIYGSIEITPKDLYVLFGSYREAYSFKDDLYFYFFNENNKTSNFRLSFFDPSNNQVDIVNSEVSLSNLILAWV
jgi:hypothetical protein